MNTLRRESNQTSHRSRPDWQSQTGINPALHMEQADHLRVGEPLKLILVNRRTGYIGTALTQMPVITSGDINLPIPPIVMRPPNLKIKAQRQLKIDAGLNKDQERNLLIGVPSARSRSADPPKTIVPPCSVYILGHPSPQNACAQRQVCLRRPEPSCVRHDTPHCGAS